MKIVGKKVTETWCIEKAASKSRKKRKKKNESDSSDVDDDGEEESIDDENNDFIPLTSKGKSSKGKPPKNSNFSRSRPKRAKQVSYAEFGED